MDRAGPVVLAAPPAAGSGRSVTAATAAAAGVTGSHALNRLGQRAWRDGLEGLAAREGVCRVESSRQVLHLKAELLDLFQPSSQEPIDVPFGAEPCNCLIVGP